MTREQIIAALIHVARMAFDALDNSEETAKCNLVDHDDAVALQDALAVLDTLPDEPGYDCTGPRKAEYALRSLAAEKVQPVPIEGQECWADGTPVTAAPLQPGWVSVPREPTAEMLEAVADDLQTATAKRIYRAMLAALPDGRR